VKKVKQARHRSQLAEIVGSDM